MKTLIKPAKRLLVTPLILIYTILDVLIIAVLMIPKWIVLGPKRALPPINFQAYALVLMKWADHD